jgi:hypothetical protein
MHLVLAALTICANDMLRRTVCQLLTLQWRVEPTAAAAALCNVVLQVNAALEEVVAHAALCYKQMVLVSRNQLNRVAAEERQRWHDLYHGVEVSSLAHGGQLLARAPLCAARQQHHVYVQRCAFAAIIHVPVMQLFTAVCLGTCCHTHRRLAAVKRMFATLHHPCRARRLLRADSGLWRQT